jgi:hypothetical protein
MRRIRNWPVMSEKCASCPFRDDGDKILRARVLERTILQCSQICHHPRTHGKKETHLCRGARDEQLTILYRMGLIPEPTDAAFAETSRRILGA